MLLENMVFTLAVFLSPFSSFTCQRSNDIDAKRGTQKKHVHTQKKHVSEVKFVITNHTIQFWEWFWTIARICIICAGIATKVAQEPHPRWTSRPSCAQTLAALLARRTRTNWTSESLHNPIICIEKPMENPWKPKFANVCQTQTTFESQAAE